VTELVARASDRWDRAALDLAFALVVVFCEQCGAKLEAVYGSFLLTVRPRGEIRTANFRVVFDVTGFQTSAWRTKRTGEIRSRAELRANKFSPKPILSFGAK
jgi:hypothetical protein